MIIELWGHNTRSGQIEFRTVPHIQQGVVKHSDKFCVCLATSVRLKHYLYVIVMHILIRIM